MRTMSFLPRILIFFSGLALASEAGQASYQVKVDLSKVERVSKTTATLQVVVNPLLRRSSAIHARVFRAMKGLEADDLRYVPWLPFPKLAVAELDPPKNGKTYWDFSLIDPMTIDFFEATKGHEPILNFSTIPQWMLQTVKPVLCPPDPDQGTWEYEQGTEFRDQNMEEFGNYYARLVSWYTQGGFSDENGQRHDSGYHYKIRYWEVLNEVDLEHRMTPQQYAACYDAIVSAIRRIQSNMKFIGPALALPSTNPQFFEYFLDHQHHKPGIPLDMISYHFYAVPQPDETPEIQQFTFFQQADHFIDTANYIDSIRQRLSPETGTAINELRCISADDLDQQKPGHVTKRFRTPTGASAVQCLPMFTDA